MAPTTKLVHPAPSTRSDADRRDHPGVTATAFAHTWVERPAEDAKLSKRTLLQHFPDNSAHRGVSARHPGLAHCPSDRPSIPTTPAAHWPLTPSRAAGSAAVHFT